VWLGALITVMDISTPTIPPVASGLPTISVTLVRNDSLLSGWCAHGCGARRLRRGVALRPQPAGPGSYGVPALICGML
jgi:hypothetical protein